MWIRDNARTLRLSFVTASVAENNTGIAALGEAIRAMQANLPLQQAETEAAAAGHGSRSGPSKSGPALRRCTVARLTQRSNLTRKGFS